jgi:hypothetical protein
LSLNIYSYLPAHVRSFQSNNLSGFRSNSHSSQFISKRRICEQSDETTGRLHNAQISDCLIVRPIPHGNRVHRADTVNNTVYDTVYDTVNDTVNVTV